MITTLTKCPELPDELWIHIFSFIYKSIPIPIKISSKFFYHEITKIEIYKNTTSILNDIILLTFLNIDRNNNTIHTAVSLDGKNTIYVPHYNVLSIKNGIAKLFFY